MLVYDETQIRARLESLPPFLRSALALGLAEHWLPAFEAFAEGQSHGRATAIGDALERSWRVVPGSATCPVDGRALEQQLALVEGNEGRSAEAAQAAAYIACYALDATNDPASVDHAVYAARWAYTGIDAQLGYDLGEELTRQAASPNARTKALAKLDARIKRHGRMQMALGILHGALSDLESLANSGGDVLACRSRWAATWPEPL